MFAPSYPARRNLDALQEATPSMDAAMRTELVKSAGEIALTGWSAVQLEIVHMTTWSW